MKYRKYGLNFISGEGIVSKLVVKDVQSQIETELQEDDSQCNYTTSEETFTKDIENVNQECDNDYDADTEKHSSELTQPKEEEMKNKEKAKGKDTFNQPSFNTQL